MGQKKTKIMIDTDEIITSKFLNISSTYSSNSLYFETLSKTKSYLDSAALSNDSGCYSEKNNQTSTVSLSSRLQEDLRVECIDQAALKDIRKKEKRNERAQLLCEQINRILEITLTQVLIIISY